MTDSQTNETSRKGKEDLWRYGCKRRQKREDERKQKLGKSYVGKFAETEQCKNN